MTPLNIFLVCLAALLGGFVANVIITAFKKKENPFAALTQTEQAWVAEAKRAGGAVKLDFNRGEAIGESLVQKVDADVIGILHKAELEGTLIAGTVKAYVEKFVGIAQTVIAPAAPTPPAPAPAPVVPAPAPEPAPAESSDAS